MKQWEINLVEETLKEKGLEITTTPKQRKNGTIQIMDPQTSRTFAITKYGYIRTYVKTYHGSPMTYQLNPKKPKDLRYPTSRLLYPLSYYFMSTLLWESILRIRKNNL